MKAFSIRQPWAWLIVNGYKDIENRTWETKFRGWFAIQATKNIDWDAYIFIKEEHPEIDIPDPDELETGGIVGTAFLLDCVQDHKSIWKEDGSYGFVIGEAHPHKFIPLKGKLKFFDIPTWNVTIGNTDKGGDVDWDTAGDFITQEDARKYIDEHYGNYKNFITHPDGTEERI